MKRIIALIATILFSTTAFAKVSENDRLFAKQIGEQIKTLTITKEMCKAFSDLVGVSAKARDNGISQPTLIQSLLTPDEMENVSYRVFVPLVIQQIGMMYMNFSITEQMMRESSYSACSKWVNTEMVYFAR